MTLNDLQRVANLVVRGLSDGLCRSLAGKQDLTVSVLPEYGVDCRSIVMDITYGRVSN